MIRFENIELKHSKKFNTLQDINLQVNKKEKVAIVGSENSGKHSVARIIAKLEKQTKGEVFIGGVNIKNVNYKTDVSLGYLRAIPIFFKRKTVKQNLQQVLKIRGLSAKEINELVLETIKKYNIIDIANLKIKDLSFYEKLVVSIARLDLRKLDILVLEDVINLKNFKLNRKKGLRKKTHSNKDKSKFNYSLDFENVHDDGEIKRLYKKIDMLLKSHKNATIVMFCEKDNKILSQQPNFRVVNMKYGSIT